MDGENDKINDGPDVAHPVRPKGVGILMANEKMINERIRRITQSILDDYKKGRDIDKTDVFSQPDSDAVTDIVNKLLNILFPGYYREKNYRSYNDNSRISILIEDVVYNLTKQIAIALRFREEYADTEEAEIKDISEDLALQFISRIPAIRELVDTDMEAFYQGDPAAYNKEEIVLCYPGLLASTVNRLAHELFLLKVPLIPRMMTEYAHSRTGIDIHPGATIGRYFFMDHGTGIVVGETSVIGEHVKIYQGVTIGALSTRGGQSLRGAKRHPTIEDDVTGSVIGSNVFITSSVRPGTRMSVKTQELVIRHKEEAVAPTTETEEVEVPREEAAEGAKPENWYME